MTAPVLDVRKLTAGYGTVPIITGIDLTLNEREIVVIAGPNGAGKSTLLKAVLGLNQLFSGEILLNGESIMARRTAELVPLGMAAVPQSKNIFPTLTVDENLDVGTYARPPADKARTRERVLTLFPDLRDKLRQEAGELSGGQRQMAAIGRALMSDPTVLLLDEPTAGLSPAYLEKIFDLVLGIRDTGISILMVEQNARQALRIADTGHILVSGETAYRDTGANLLADEEVRRAFLGGAAA